MSHVITIKQIHLIQALKDTVEFTDKKHDELSHLKLTVQPRIGKLTISATDGRGYIERTIPLVKEKGVRQASLPAPAVFITSADVAMLTKFMPVRDQGYAVLEINDELTKGKRYPVRLTLANGANTTFFLPADVNYPDLSGVVRKAERAKDSPTPTSGMFFPVSEMYRISKVLPKSNGETVAVHTSKASSTSQYCLIEYVQDSCVETKIIFITACMAEHSNNARVAVAA